MSNESVQLYAGRHVELGALPVLRALPAKGRRLVGPWCFLDRFGPLTFGGGTPMDVAPHPHMGLQTVTWLLDGEVVHDDSLDNQAVLEPGGVNVMTSGHAIAHAERTPAVNSGRLNGVQLWTALPDEHRHRGSSFQHVAEVPVLDLPGGIIRVFAGTMSAATSPAHHYSDLIGADVQIHRGEAVTFALNGGHEHALLILAGDCMLEGVALRAGTLYYLGTGRNDLSLRSSAGARVLLIGGPPFPETILMWWNFVARTPDEISQAREDWEAHRRFGDVRAYKGQRIPAPDLLRLAQPNPVS